MTPSYRYTTRGQGVTLRHFIFIDQHQTLTGRGHQKWNIDPARPTTGPTALTINKKSIQLPPSYLPKRGEDATHLESDRGHTRNVSEIPKADFLQRPGTAQQPKAKTVSPWRLWRWMSCTQPRILIEASLAAHIAAVSQPPLSMSVQREK